MYSFRCHSSDLFLRETDDVYIFGKFLHVFNLYKLSVDICEYLQTFQLTVFGRIKIKVG